MTPGLSLGWFVLPMGLSLSVTHHPLLCCYHKQAAYEAEGEVQLATEPQAPGAPTWGDTPPAAASTAGTTKAKENSRRKDTSWYPTWSYLRSIQWPSSLVQVSVQWGEEGRGDGWAPMTNPVSGTCGPLQPVATAVKTSTGLGLSSPLCQVPPGPGQAFCKQEAPSGEGVTNVWEQFRPKE